MKIDIDYDFEQIEINRKRLEAFEKFEKPDRIPLILGLEIRFFLYHRNVSFEEFFRSPENMIFHQVMNKKWRLEHIHDNCLCLPCIDVFPDFQNTTTAGIFSDNIIWHKDNPPRFFPVLNKVSDIDKLKPLKDCVAGKKIKYAVKMKKIAEGYDITINSKKIPVRVVPGYQEGVVTAALDLAGENLLVWAVEHPQKVKKLCEIITEESIKFEKSIRKLTDFPMESSGQSTDGAEMFSPQMFDEIFVPYLNSWYEEFGGARHIHHCGESEHLWEIYRDKVKFTHFDGFSYNCNRKRLREFLGNKVHLMGNIDPFVFVKSLKEIKDECRDVLNNFGELRGFVLMDGFNIPPDALPEKLNIVNEVLDEYYS